MINIDEAVAMGLIVFDARQDPVLHDLIWRLYTSIICTFDRSAANKIFENSNGEALIRLIRQPIQQTPANPQVKPVKPAGQFSPPTASKHSGSKRKRR